MLIADGVERLNQDMADNHLQGFWQTVIYHAVRGSGTTFVGSNRLDWERGDCFVVPLRSAHRHLNRSSSEEALLFSMSDAPVRRALALYQEEPLPGGAGA